MLIYSTLTTLSKDKGINPRKAKILIDKDIFEISIQRKIGKTKKIGYVHIKDVVKFLLENYK